MIAAVVLGALTGAGILLVLWQIVPRRTSALVQLGRFDARRPPQNPFTAGPDPDLTARMGTVVLAWTAGRRLSYSTLVQDLALTGRSIETTMGIKALTGLGGFLAVLTAAVLLPAAAGATLPAGLLLAVALIAGAVGFIAPDLQARQDAHAARQDFRSALSAYLDLVSLEMAGAAAPAQALTSAARIGTGWPIVLLRDTLQHATESGQTQWAALRDLGDRIGVPELTALGDLISRVEHEGAAVRDTLTARSAALRRTHLADLETLAGQRSQSMIVATIILGLGFLVFLLYPAIVSVATL